MTASGSDRVVLRLLATSDLHACLKAHDYHADEPSEGVGLVRLATLIRQARKEVANTLLFDNGDLIQGSPIGENAVGEHTGPHPMIAALNALRYDAATLGNHDFDFGLSHAISSYRQAAFPVVVTNLHIAPGEMHPFAQRTIIGRRVVSASGQVHDLKVGLIGLLPVQTALWNKHHFEGRAEVSDVVSAAKKAARALKAGGADLIVALAHTGLSTGRGTSDPENLGIPLARIDNIGVLVLGHTHEVFPGRSVQATVDLDPTKGTVGGKPAVMPGFHGSHLGVVDLVLAPSAAGWSVLSHRSEARPAAQNTRDEPGQPYAGEDAAIAALAAPSHLIARRRLSAPVGATDRALHSYFALARPAAALALVADAQREFVSEKIPAQFAGLPILSAVAPLKAGGRTGPKNYTDISAGPLALRHVEALCPYPNTLCAVISTGDEVASWLERSASIFRHVSPGIAGQPLHAAHAQGYTFDALDGLTYEIDLSAKSGERRVRDIRFDGKPVRTEDRFIVATNNHRIAQGNLGEVVLASERLTRDIVADHIRKLGVVSPTARDTWRLSRVPGASVTFTTGPGALPFLGKGEGLGMTALGPSTDGFVYVGFRSD